MKLLARNRNRNRSALSPCFGWALLLFSCSCGAGATASADASAATQTTQYVGSVSGTDALIAVAVRDNHVAAYVCGGSSSFALLTHWFTGDMTATGTAFDLSAQGFVLHAVFSVQERVQGTVTMPDGVSHDFSALRTNSETLAGLYSTVDDNCRTGVVVVHDSAANPPTVQGTWCSEKDTSIPTRFQQVMPIAPVALVNQGLRVRVNLPAGQRELIVTRVVPPLQ